MGAENGFVAAATMGVPKVYGVETVCDRTAEAIPAQSSTAVPHRRSADLILFVAKFIMCAPRTAPLEGSHFPTFLPIA
jgi:hypothetical protein